ncbi:MAG: hypothetical protein O3A14_12495 [Cyanobacteria bacterium]|nr:hypothetical protein [Cyanobacteriota bacterium]
MIKAKLLLGDKRLELTQTLYGQMAESERLDAVIRENLEGLGYGK